MHRRLLQRLPGSARSNPMVQSARSHRDQGVFAPPNYLAGDWRQGVVKGRVKAAAGGLGPR